MTDEERREAERLWIQFVLSRINKNKPDDRLIWDSAFAAACEAKRADIKECIWRLGRAVKNLEVERARSEWLLDLIEDLDQELHRAIVTDNIGVGDRP